MTNHNFAYTIVPAYEFIRFGGGAMQEAVTDIYNDGKNRTESGAAGFPSLVSQYMPQIRAIVKKYAPGGANYYDDLVQEGLLGLYKAVLFYDSGRNVPFSAFALLCIKRQVLNAARKYFRYGSDCLFGTDEFTDGSVQQYDDPENAVLQKEAFSLTLHRMKECLSDYEYAVLTSYLCGAEYKEIARAMNKSPKSVGNALTRIKNKLAKGL